MINSFKEGQYIIYKNGDRYEIGKIKRVVNDGAFVFYSEGDTASKTPFGCMHEIINDYAIGETNLGGRTTPVRHAHWITKTRHEHYPSGKEYEEDYCSACGMRGSLVYDYCPHCGAFMEEVSE